MNNQVTGLSDSVFVSASAGTGKTKLLIDRLLFLLVTKVNPSKIVCLTFSKTAAAEVNTRIINQLANLTVMEEQSLVNLLKQFGFNKIDQDIIDYVRNLFSEVVLKDNNIKIQTIHSFAQSILMRFTKESGLKSNFKICDDNDRQIYNTKVREKLFETTEKDTNLSHAIEYLSWHLKDFTINSLISEIINSKVKIEFNQDDKLYFNQAIEASEIQLIKQFVEQISINHKIIDFLMQGSKTDIAKAESLKAFANYSINKKNIYFKNYLKIFLTAEYEPLKSMYSKKIFDLETQEFLHFEQQRVIKFWLEYNNIKNKNISKAFNILVFNVKKFYDYLKQENSQIDYQDIIDLFIQLLTKSEYAQWIKYILFEEIDHILVDEAQDNSLKQWQIINLLSDEFIDKPNKSLFFVGDVKQSIFGFQGADPRIFYYLGSNLPQNVTKLNLDVSYRSAKEILSLVDHIFNKSFIKEQMHVLDEVIKHQTVISKKGSVELWPLEIIESETLKKSWCMASQESDCKYQAKKSLSNKIAMYIKDKIKNGSRPEDFLILLRRRGDIQKLIIDALLDFKIPVTGLDRFFILDHPAILDVLSLCRFILCPMDEFNLAILLKSPLINLSDQQLNELCINRDKNLWLKIEHSSDGDYLKDIIKQAQNKDLYQFLFDLFEYQGIRSKLVQYFASDTNDVLDNFLNLVNKFLKHSTSSLQLFIDYLENCNYQVKIDMAEDQGKVRIMTVHASKGLQAPYVILADSNDVYHVQEKLYFNDDQEIFWFNKYNKNNLQDAKNLKKEFGQGEYLRLLYVALTRAQYHLVICGMSSKESANPGSWYQIIEDSVKEINRN